MTERDVEKAVDKSYFVETLRRLADSIEKGEAFRIQVAGERFVVPSDAELRIEHEVASGVEELALELSWRAGGPR
jgi:amphi-Trp domain-containing protein